MKVRDKSPREFCIITYLIVPALCEVVIECECVFYKDPSSLLEIKKKPVFCELGAWAHKNEKG